MKIKIVEITNQEDEQSDFINYTAYCILNLINNFLSEDDITLEPKNIIDYSLTYINKNEKFPNEYYIKAADSFIKKIK